MSKQEWSPEPWRYDSGSAYKGQGQMEACRILEADREEPGTRPTERDANVKRAIACVNACAGIKDPEAIGEVRRLVERMKMHAIEGQNGSATYALDRLGVIEEICRITLRKLEGSQS